MSTSFTTIFLPTTSKDEISDICHLSIIRHMLHKAAESINLQKRPQTYDLYTYMESIYHQEPAPKALSAILPSIRDPSQKVVDFFKDNYTKWDQQATAYQVADQFKGMLNTRYLNDSCAHLPSLLV